MNKIVNKFLLAGDKSMPEMYLKQSRFTYSTSGPVTKNKETGDIKYLYKNELGKACFQHDMAFKDFKGLVRRADSDKVLRDKAFNIAKNPKYDGYQRGLASMVYKFFDKKTSGGAIKFMQNQKLAKELHKPIIRKFNKRRVYSSFKDNIWGADLADLQLISKFNKGIRILRYVICIYSKYAWVVPLKDKKDVTVVNTF